MRKTIVALTVAILLISSFSAVIFAATPNNLVPVSDFSQEQILVKFKPDVTLPETAEIHRQLGGQVKETIPGIGVQVVKVPKGQVMAKVKAYSANAKVAYAEPDFVVQAMDIPNDPGFANQWGIVKIQAPQAWDVTTGSSNISIAILDTGVDMNHPDLANKIISNINFSSSNTTDDVYGHGTAVAGIAAAITNNGIGVAGLGYSATIMNVKVLGDDGVGYWSWIAQGIIWAADNGAKVINLSLGGSSGSSTVESAINYAWNKGVVIVAAAGNYGNSAPCFPAYYTNCIAVAGTDSLDRLAGWSDYGDWVDVAAPGVNILSTYLSSINGGYNFMSGTSMASPHVAGLAALVFTVVNDSNGNGRLNDEVRARIQANCDDIGVSGIGSGLINAYKAVLDGGTTPLPPTTGNISGKVTDAAGNSLISGATVSDGTRTAATDASGQYIIADVPQGSYTVTASVTGYSASSQGVSVVAGQTATANFALTKLALPDPKPLWVSTIAFRMMAKNLRLSINIVSASGTVAGAQVAVQLTNGVQNWTFVGTADSSGTATFTLNKPPAGTYVASVTAVTATGYTWDTTQGVTSATYTLKGGGGKK
jgi:thermitase